MIYTHPPPGIGHRRGVLPQWQEAPDQATFARVAQEHTRTVIREINDERRRVAQWLAAHRAIARTHVIVATQSGFHFFVAGFGYWNVLDIDLCLQNESCVGVKAFEVGVSGDATPEQADDDDTESIDQTQLPVLIIALTTYVKRSNETKNDVVDESGSYRLYALGADSLPPLTPEFIEKHALRTDQAPIEKEPKEKKPADSAVSDDLGDLHTVTLAQRANTLPVTSSTADDVVTPQRCTSDNQTQTLAEEFTDTTSKQSSNTIRDLPMNSFAYLEERLFSLAVTENRLGLDLDYLPFRISQDVSDGMPPVLLVAGNDNRVHRYALGRGQIIEIEPLL
ncbi:hypothetical protein GGF47_006083, partial [Coemansia sp. RSA 2524]